MLSEAPAGTAQGYSGRAVARAAAGVMAATLVSKLLGFGREAALAAVYGASVVTDAYLVAAVIPTMLFGIVSSAITTVGIPVLSECLHREENRPHQKTRRWCTSAPTTSSRAIKKKPGAFTTSAGRSTPTAKLSIVTNQGITTWYGFARRIVELAGVKARVLPVTSGEFPRPAKRPANSVLDPWPLAETLGYLLPPWEEALSRYLRSVHEHS